MTERVALLVVFNLKARAKLTQRSAWSLWVELMPHIDDDQRARLKVAWFACADGEPGSAARLDQVTEDIKREWST